MINIHKQTKWYNDKADAIDNNMRLLGFYRKPMVNLFCDSARLFMQLMKNTKRVNDWLGLLEKSEINFIETND